jgi:hypothetical protein
VLTKAQIAQANAAADELGETVAPGLPARTAQRVIPTNHDNIATALLTDMLKRNLALAGRMVEIGELTSAKRLLQSAISQCDQIASYNQPSGAHRDAATTVTEV